MACATCYRLGSGWLVFVIEISVAYVAIDGTPYYRELSVPQGTTIKAAIEQSGLLCHHALLDIKLWIADTPIDVKPNQKAWRVGVFAQKKSLGEPVCEGDRIELYRPLRLDPKHARKNKVAADQKRLARLRSAPKH